MGDQLIERALTAPSPADVLAELTRKVQQAALDILSSPQGHGEITVRLKTVNGQIKHDVVVTLTRRY